MKQFDEPTIDILVGALVIILLCLWSVCTEPDWIKHDWGMPDLQEASRTEL